MIKRVPCIVVFIFCFALNALHGQTFQERFEASVMSNDTLQQWHILKEWETSKNHDPEFYIAYYNYYVNKCQTEVIAFGSEPREESLEITPVDSASDAPPSYLYSEIHYNRDTLNKGFEWIDKGIKQYPNRLDLRFGKIYMLSLVDDYDYLTSQIIETVNYSVINNNEWLFTHNEPLDNAEETFLEALQDYQQYLYGSGNDALLQNMQEIALAILKHYPENVMSLSNASIIHLVREEYDKALEYLLIAEKVSPKDPVILGNIALVYHKTGELKKAIRYYEKLLQHGDENTKAFAEGKIIEIKKEAKR